MPRYRVGVYVNESNINRVRKALESALAGMNVTFEVKKQETFPSRADRLSEAVAAVRNASSDLEELKDELENWKDSMPENLQNGSKADEVQEAMDALETAQNSLDSAADEMDQVSFPGMR